MAIATIVIEPNPIGREETRFDHRRFLLTGKTRDGKISSIERDVRGYLPLDVRRKEVEEKLFVGMDGIHIVGSEAPSILPIDRETIGDLGEKVPGPVSILFHTRISRSIARVCSGDGMIPSVSLVLMETICQLGWARRKAFRHFLRLPASICILPSMMMPISLMQETTYLFIE
jgi:hypothetical protein